MRDGGHRGIRAGRWVDPVGVFVLALVARVIMIADSPGGLSGMFGYDPGVYYAAGDAFGHGRLPYRDFVLLHPPGMMLFLTPFATFGRLTRDDLGFQTAVVTFMVLSSVSAALVVLIGRRLGLIRVGCLVGGGFLAVWFGTLSFDYAPRLEAFGTVLFLLGAYLLVRRGRGAPWWAGSLFGAAVTVKVWWILPVLVVAGWLARRDRGRALRFVAAATAVVVVVAGPFFVLAPGAMWRMVIESQLIRANAVTVQQHLDRVNVISAADAAFPRLPHATAGTVVTYLTLALVLAVFAAAWRARRARIFVLLAAVQVTVLLVAPSFLNFYSGYASGALALTVAAAAGTMHRVPSPRLSAPTLTAALALTVTVTALVRYGNHNIVRLPDVANGRRVAAVQRCLVTDSPMVQIELDVLSRGLANGCPNWVDVSGRSHVLDVSLGRQTVRATNPRWQALIGPYLASGDAVIIVRPFTGLSPATMRVLLRFPVLVRLGRFTLRRTVHGSIYDKQCRRCPLAVHPALGGK